MGWVINTTLRPPYTRERHGTHSVQGPGCAPGPVRRISPPPGFDPRTVQPVASRYTEYAIPVPTSALQKYEHEVIPVSGFSSQNMKGRDYLEQLGLNGKAILKPNTKHEALEVRYSEHLDCIHLTACFSVSYRISSYIIKYRKMGKRL
jgi:hypothetical protein